MVVQRGFGLSKLVLKRRIRSVGRVYAKNTNEFLKNTTINGLNYINRKELYMPERLYFALALVTVILLCAYFILNVYVKWTTTPVILSINPNPTYVTEQPFPAVTVCNLNQAQKHKVNNFSVFSTEFAMLQMLCKREVNVTIAGTITNWSMLKDFIINVSQPCSNMLLGCRFGAVDFNCSELFHPIVADEGLCCTFNMVDSKFLYILGESTVDFNVSYPKGYEPVEWSVDRGYGNGDKLRRHHSPMSTVGTGESLGLSLILNVDAENYYCSSSNSVGFKMSIHNPSDIPKISEIGLLIPPGYENIIRIEAQKFESDERLLYMDKRKRKCLFEHEGKLEIFSHYTPRNCEHECVAKILLAHCGCQSHFMPRLPVNSSTCGIYEAACVERVRLRAVSDAVANNCHDMCLPGCFDLNFSSDIFYAPLSHLDFQIRSRLSMNLSSAYVMQNIAVLKLYLKENKYRSHRQSEFIGATDVLSNVGGLICLFFGFSFISLTEFFFYAMIRPCRPMRQVAPTAGDKAVGSTGRPYPPLAGRARNRFRNPFKYPHYTIYNTAQSNRLWNADYPASSRQLQRNMVGATLKRRLHEQTLRRWYQQHNQQQRP